jgi:hypothetical protein
MRMWEIDPEPFKLAACTKGNLVPLSYWLDGEFPECTYTYTVAGEDIRCLNQDVIDPARVRFIPPKELCRDTPLGGRAWRELWQRRNEIPAEWWAQCSELDSMAQFYCTGIDIHNPHGVRCWPYLRRTRGSVWWGYSPITYDWGQQFPALVLAA